MYDLNEWRLEYPGTTLNFGTLALDYPLSVQVDIGDTDMEDQDQAHPTSDGVVMGRDRFGGFAINFEMKVLPENPPVAKMWTNPLDMYSAFRSAWRADTIRRTPGAYATLSNLDRGRLVYGRPRKCAPKLDKVRKGLLEFMAQFQTNGPEWYSIVEHSATITPVPPAIGGIVGPLAEPITTSGSTDDTSPVVNAGDLDAWPIIEFHGPGSGFGFELLDGTDSLWVVTVPGSLKYDEVLTLDTRPWNRSATINGLPANGRIRGDKVEDLGIPVGNFDVRFTVADPTGTAFVVVKWRDAFASM